MTWRSLRLQLAGLGLVVFLVGVVVLAFAQFNGDFTTTKAVTVSAPRAGLVLDPNAEVKLRGVKIGHVSKISRSGDQTGAGLATLTLALQPDSLRLLPANVSVDIVSTTVFGAKYVDFVIPKSPTRARLEPGATVPANSVTVEFNTVFEQLVVLLDKVNPEQVNATLTAIDTALHGRGEQLGQTLTQLDDYLKAINPLLPTVRQDFDKTADVSNLYAQTGPDLLRTVDNATVTSKSIVAERQALAASLQHALALNNQTGGVLRANQKQLAGALAMLKSTTAVLGLYAPVLNCTITALDNFQPLGEKIFGGNGHGVALNAGFMPPPMPYLVPQDLPKVNATGGPNCWGLPNPPIGPYAPHAPFVVTDNATVPYAPATRQDFGGPLLWKWLYNIKPDDPSQAPPARATTRGAK